ncbi:type IV toxin-antitoxin system AbiEi family antitoxin [Marinomonas polaris]|uniref:type IV toxin-antitoxin system AbiEi family antitoxin n=1 Tax=Marinomonas polaris TaxID=293552 RepID=UPI003513A505
MTKQSALAVNALALLPAHIKADFVQNECVNSEHFTDGELCLTVSGDEYHFYVAVKTIHRKESLNSLFADAAPNTLLICNRLTPYLADICMENGVNFIDSAGNVRINNGTLHIWIESKKPNPSQIDINLASKSNTLGEGAAKLLFVLLSSPDVLNLSYREIAEYANISLGMVSKGLGILQAESLISLGYTRRILDAERMLNLWVEAYRLSIRPKLGGIRLQFEGDWQDVPMKENDFWGGEAAAEKLTHYLHPQELQLFTRQPLQKKLAQLKCRPNPEGNLWLVPAFWGAKLAWSETSQALLAVAELEASKDSRNIEVARMIHEQYL